MFNHQPFASGDEIIRSGEHVDDVKIETADISNKFKFFETYRPAEHERKQFRITPPRDGAAPTNGDTNGDTNGEANGETNGTNGTNGDHHYADTSAKSAQRSATTTKMLSMFRQMEEAERTPQQSDGALKPLKCFTPPPDDNRRVQNNHNSESENDCTDSEEEVISIYSYYLQHVVNLMHHFSFHLRTMTRKKMKMNSQRVMLTKHCSRHRPLHEQSNCAPNSSAGKPRKFNVNRTMPFNYLTAMISHKLKVLNRK